MLYQIAVLSRLLAVITWIGGGLFLVMALALAPLTRRSLEPPSLVAQGEPKGSPGFGPGGS